MQFSDLFVNDTEGRRRVGLTLRCDRCDVRFVLVPERGDAADVGARLARVAAEHGGTVPEWNDSGLEGDLHDFSVEELQAEAVRLALTVGWDIEGHAATCNACVGRRLH